MDIDGKYFVADDTDVKVYSCAVTIKHENREAALVAAPFAGREVGQQPVNCPSWAAPAPRAESDTRMRDMVAAWEARQKARADRDMR